ncbi:MAG: hypothetical protein H0T46_27910 [Deltaproteobacteria bacterium]|nr:hypothetical protein [Deltaproteobacteria bacterium]
MTKRSPVLMCSLAAVVLAGCAEPTTSAPSPDAPLATADAPTGTSNLPSWSLEDVQPTSPRVGQTYGLDTFTGKIIVVSLLEGF